MSSTVALRHRKNVVAHRNSLIFLACIILFANIITAGSSNAAFGAENLKLDELSDAQKISLDAFISKQENQTGKLVCTVDRAHMFLISSKALKALFPNYQFVKIPISYHGNPLECSIPHGIACALALPDAGAVGPAFYNYGNGELFGQFLHDERVKIDTEAVAAQVWSAFQALNYGGGDSQAPRRRDGSWILGYSENPFRDISDSEKIREAYYYEVPIDSSATAISGEFKCVILEKQKIK